MGINEQLEALYGKYFDNFIEELLKLEKESNEECSNPLLMYCWESEYKKANENCYLLEKKQIPGMKKSQKVKINLKRI